jgi:hypothetical protein
MRPPVAAIAGLVCALGCTAGVVAGIAHDRDVSMASPAPSPCVAAACRPSSASAGASAPLSSPGLISPAAGSDSTRAPWSPAPAAGEPGPPPAGPGLSPGSAGSAGGGAIGDDGLPVDAPVVTGPTSTGTQPGAPAGSAAPGQNPPDQNPPASSSGPTPDGIPAAQVGALQENDSAADLMSAWDDTTLIGTDCTKPGTVALDGSVVDLTTNGTTGNCAKLTSTSRYPFGVFEARFWVQAGPDGKIANWPAFWLTGASWPVDGEIDAFEGLGGEDAATFHYGTTNLTHTKADNALKPGWVTVGVVWEPGMLAIYYNGQKFVEWDGSEITSSPLSVAFDMTTGSYGDTTGQPSTMKVSYLRYWLPPGS